MTQLTAAGARFYYHGDFDWPGLGIGNFIMRQYGARPWHFSAADYAAAVMNAQPPKRASTGVEVVAAWDLANVKRQHRLTIDEEAVTIPLLRGRISDS